MEKAGFPRTPGLVLGAILIALLSCNPFAVSAAPDAKVGTERRIALVIGNSNYSAVPVLPNPRDDARMVAQTLERVGFSRVDLAMDLSRDQLTEALRQFAQRADGADWAVVYYAGHGIEIGGRNYLVPVDAHLAMDQDVEFEAVPLRQVLASVGRAKRLRLIILDACRDNPFLNQMKRSIAARGVTRGLARIEPEGGVLIAYAAKDGETALDGDGHSPFSTALVSGIDTPGLEVSRLFRRVRSDVLKATGNLQEPFTYGSLPDEDFYFRTTDALSPVAGKPPMAGTEAAPAGTPGPSPVTSVKSVETASLEPSSAISSDRAPSPSGEAPTSRSLQRELRRVGCYRVRLSDQWGPPAQAALDDFRRYAKLTGDLDRSDPATIEAVRARTDRVCPALHPEARRPHPAVQHAASAPPPGPSRHAAPSRHCFAAEGRQFCDN